MTVAELFAEIELKPRGPLAWATIIPEDQCGVYVIALTNDMTSSRVTGFSFTEKVEQDRWLKDEPILYIGQTTKQSLKHRVNQFYRHKYGARSPHRGGQAVKLLLNAECSEPHLQLWVHWAPTSDPCKAERIMLLAFKRHTGRWPFANRKYPKLCP